ncbi:MAG TPA: hypothetical protein VFM98_19835 [Ramlibacter sp.]|uniref:hypothetical protein n=1 Tax=Ramlibacter sp. TaxID=1917967 RepID=UPI002D7FB3A5|nr:hypothetical protein [Ramlibacter sp.]HET8747861.1 hypothetical protein [Ramlibacter sp.]
MTRPYYPVSRSTRRQYRSQAAMLRLLAGVVLATLLALALLASDLAHAASGGAVAEFDGGIGVQPATWAGANNANPIGGDAAANNVNDTPPAGRPWVIEDLKAKVSRDGSFDIRGKGLIFAGSPNVGRSGNVSVRARLYCGAGATLAKFTSEETVQLAPNGDFRLRGEFAVMNAPLACPNAVLLILNAGESAANAGGWFAAGIPKD